MRTTVYLSDLVKQHKAHHATWTMNEAGRYTVFLHYKGGNVVTLPIANGVKLEVLK